MARIAYAPDQSDGNEPVSAATTAHSVGSELDVDPNSLGDNPHAAMVKDTPFSCLQVALGEEQRRVP
jgi:hypothetical protein